MANDTLQIQEQQQKWFERFLRFGLVSKGVVYCLVGVLAFMAAYDIQKQEASKTSAIGLIHDQPFGKFLMAIIATGLFGYVTLRFVQAFRDIDNKGAGAKGLMTRFGYGFSGLLYLALAVYAVRLLFAGTNTDSESEKFTITKILTYETGPWFIGTTGLIIIGNGIYQIYRAVSGTFMKKITVMRADLENVFKKAGIVGYISRGIVLVIIGYLLLHAALTSDPANVRGSSKEAFNFIEHTFGGLLMSLIAVGLIGYGLFNFVKAKFQRIQF